MCQQGAWDFEDMTVGGFRILNSPSAAEKVGITGQIPPHSGKYTFGIQIAASGFAGAPTRIYQVGQGMCLGRGFVRAKYVTAWMMLDPNDERQAALGAKSYFGIRIYTDRGEFVATGAPKGFYEWFPVSVLVEASELQAIVFEGYFEPTGAAAPSPWNGYVYVDDVLVE
jgi:hypothetical protein